MIEAILLSIVIIGACCFVAGMLVGFASTLK